MGFIKDAKAKSIAEQAARAISEGRQVFACRVNEGGWNDNWGGSLSGVAEQIEAVESAGWRLDQSTFLPGKGQNVSAFLIFRRAQVPAPQAYQVQPGTTWGQQG
ncbi:hypothetical protein [Streptomyces canus]|uniref:hypothetical protein n=1 Tax=Streptomyces canus TaxID=58343 RepID=UPI000375E736|nr:hypothetical protein [Streptomyces canus]